MNRSEKISKIEQLCLRDKSRLKLLVLFFLVEKKNL